MGDEILKLLFKMEFSNVKIQSIVDVGRPRLKKIRLSMEGNSKEAVESMKGVRKPVKHAASEEAIARIVDHISSNMSFHTNQDTEYPLVVVGMNQWSTWTGVNILRNQLKLFPVFMRDSRHFSLLFLEYLEK